MAGQPDHPRVLTAPLVYSREQQIFKSPLVLVLELHDGNSFVIDEDAARPVVSTKKMEVMVQGRAAHSSLGLSFIVSCVF